ncbi:MAG: CPBP family intramembrane metalloprotease [Proteobacteria bacterium]|nr:CPBP family intramembrane metalloprotease [Pseudomonadota bacterium]
MAVGVAGLVQIKLTLPYVGNVGAALVAILFLYAPVFAAWRRQEVLEDYGFHAEPVPRGLAFAGAALAIIVPVFVVGYFAFYELACNRSVNLLTHLTPRGQCARYAGLAALHAPALTGKLAEFIAVQFVVVALPEELFFRGFLLGMLEKRFPPKRRWLGGGIGLALVLSSAMFAVVHLPRDGDPSALATFFPGLMFGWMRSATGSLLASTVTHAGSNILIHVLELMAAR